MSTHSLDTYTIYTCLCAEQLLNIKFRLSKFNVPVAPLDISKPEETIVRPVRTLLYLSEKIMIYDFGHLVNTFKYRLLPY